jgi:hypothetical protein
MTSDDDDGPLTPAQQRVHELLVPLARPEPEAPPHLVEGVMHTVRWQYAVRGVLRAAGSLAAGMAEAAAGVIGLRSKRDER